MRRDIARKFASNVCVQTKPAQLVGVIPPNPRKHLKAKVGAKTDTDELEKEREICRTRLRQTIGAKNKLAEQMDALDVSDKFYDRKYEDMQDRMDKLYEEIGAIEDEIDTISMRIDNINKKQLSNFFGEK